MCLWKNVVECSCGDDILNEVGWNKETLKTWEWLLNVINIRRFKCIMYRLKWSDPGEQLFNWAVGRWGEREKYKHRKVFQLFKFWSDRHRQAQNIKLEVAAGGGSLFATRNMIILWEIFPILMKIGFLS